MEETRVLTIVFTDIKGFTERTSHSDRESVSRLLAKHEELLLPLVKKYDGILIKTIGDAFLLSFASPTNAVLCSVMMQEKLKDFNATVVEAEKIEIRIAMNTGEVIMRDGDVYGEPVNVAARIESLTEANEVWFSESTYLAMNRQEVPTSLIGEYRLKGIPEAVRVYRVVRDANSESYAKTVQSQLEKCNRIVAEVIRPTASSRQKGISFFLGFCILLALAYVVFKESDHNMHLRLGKSAMASKDFRGALESFKKAALLQPVASETTLLITEAIDNHVKQRLSVDAKNAETLIALDEFIKEARLAFSTLDARLLQSEIDLTIEQAELNAQNRERDAADLMLDNLAKLSKNNGAVLFRIGSFYSKYGYNWTRTIKYMYEAAIADPATFANNPAVINEFTWFLGKISPSEGYDEVRSFIVNNCYDHFAPMLLQALYAPGEENHIMRWNARQLLPGKGVKIDETRFFLVDLFTSPGDLNSAELTQTLNYFLNNSTDTVILAEVEAQLASYPAEISLFEKYQLEEDGPAIKVAAGPLFSHMRKYFKSRIDAGEIHQRLNAWKVLSLRKQLDTGEIWKFHLRNMIDFKDMQWSQSYVPALLESVDFLIKNPPIPEILTDPNIAAMGKKAAIAAKALSTQIRELFDGDRQNIYMVSGERSEHDFVALAERLAQFFNGK